MVSNQIQPEPKNKIINIFRWIVFLPAAAIAAWMVAFGFGLGLTFGLRGTGITPDHLLIKIFAATAAYVIMGATFVYSGTKIVPAYRVFVALMLGIIAIIFSCSLVYSGVIFQDWWQVRDGLSIAFGGGTAALQVRTKHTISQNLTS